ncbi:hypothetical protein EJ110_NYTH24586 [Nymphaea thermarum]|nr:hypothetical protein EJ110_NYTH24586 [Nymphaea thermarum]
MNFAVPIPIGNSADYIERRAERPPKASKYNMVHCQTQTSDLQQEEQLPHPQVEHMVFENFVSYLMATFADIFGEHRSLEELQRFVQLVDRWDLQSEEQLPHPQIEEMVLENLASYLISTFSDIFGEHRSVEELQRFLQVVDRWDLQPEEQLQQPLRVLYATVCNRANQRRQGGASSHMRRAAAVLRRHRRNITSCMRRAASTLGQWPPVGECGQRSP